MKYVSAMRQVRQAIHCKVPYSHPHNPHPHPNPSYSHPTLHMVTCYDWLKEREARERPRSQGNAVQTIVTLREGFTFLRMSMNQNTFSPLLAMTQACLI